MPLRMMVVALAFAVAKVGCPIGRGDTTVEFKEKLAAAATTNKSSRSGGMLDVAAKGRIAIVSSQSIYSAEELKAIAKQNGHQIRFPIEVLSEKSFALSEANQYREKAGLGIVIYAVDNAELPLSLVAMEERWALINTAKVANRQSSPAAKHRRFQWELTRVLRSLLLAGTIEKNSKAVQTGEDLEAISRDPLDPQTLMTMIRSVPSFGLTPPRRVPYHRAVQEGWAPQPTNDIQKAIWDKVHSIPDNPMKIKFDPAAQKGKVTK